MSIKLNRTTVIFYMSNNKYITNYIIAVLNYKYYLNQTKDPKIKIISIMKYFSNTD